MRTPHSRLNKRVNDTVRIDDRALVFGERAKRWIAVDPQVRSITGAGQYGQQSGSHHIFPQHPANLCQEDATTSAPGLPSLLHPSRCSLPGGQSQNSNAQGRSPAAAAFRPLCSCKTFRSDVYGRNQRHKESDQYLSLVRGTRETRHSQGRKERETEEEVEEQ